MTRARILTIVLCGCLVVHAVWAAFEPITAADLWWMMAAGRWIVDHRTVPSVDVFSYTFQGAPWFNHEWLSEVVFYEIYRAAGGTALAILKIACVVTSFALAAWVATRRSGSLPLAIGAACAAAPLCRPFLDLRSQVFTFVATLVVLAILDAYRRGATAWTLALIPITVAVWVNLHAGFIYGIGLCVLYAGAERLKTTTGLPDRPLDARRLLPLAAVALLAPVVALLNPQGIHALTFPFSILREQSAWRDVIEWLPPVLFGSGPYSPVAFTPYLLAQLLVFGLAIVTAPRRLDVADTLLFAATVAMALTSRRFIPLFALVSTPFLARNLALVAERFARTATPTRFAAAVSVLIVLATGPVAWGLGRDLRRAAETGLFDDMARTAYFPAGGAEFLRMNALPARLFNLFTWSGYLMFALPDRPVFIDGRAHTLYPGDFWHESFAIEMGRPGWESVLDQYGVSVVLWASTAFADGGFKVFLDEISASPSWVPIYDDEHDVVFAHAERGKAWIDAYQSLALAYPDLPSAQLFAGDNMMHMGAFDRARVHFLGALARHASLEPVLRQVLAGLKARAESTEAPSDWFQVAFLHDVLGERGPAEELYRKVATTGIGEPMRSFVATALSRIESPAARE